jgi:hypothetical protein
MDIGRLIIINCFFLPANHLNWYSGKTVRTLGLEPVQEFDLII